MLLPGFNYLTQRTEPPVVASGTVCCPSTLIWDGLADSAAVFILHQLQLGNRFRFPAAAHSNQQRLNERLFKRRPASTSWFPASSRADSNRPLVLFTSPRLLTSPNNLHPLWYASHHVHKRVVPPKISSSLTFSCYRRREKKAPDSCWMEWRTKKNCCRRQSVASSSDNNYYELLSQHTLRTLPTRVIVEI